MTNLVDDPQIKQNEHKMLCWLPLEFSQSDALHQWRAWLQAPAN